MKLALDLKEVVEICAAHLRAKGHKLGNRFNLEIEPHTEKVQLVFELLKG